MGKYLIILDLDGTLYDINDVIKMSYQIQVNFLVSQIGLSLDNAINLLSKHDIRPILTKESKSATELFYKLGISKIKWNEYRNHNFDVSMIDTSKAVKEIVVSQLKRCGKVVLLSSNVFNVILKTLKHININSNIFDDIVCSDLFPVDLSFEKKIAMEICSKRFEIECNNMISIGDRFSTDILPMLELGGRGILLKKNNALPLVANDLSANSLHSNELYDYYAHL